MAIPAHRGRPLLLRRNEVDYSGFTLELASQVSPETTSIAVSVAFLVVNLGAVWWLYRYARRPRDPLRPGLLPNSLANFLFLLLVIVAFAASAHIVSLVTGKRVEPRRKKGL